MSNTEIASSLRLLGIEFFYFGLASFGVVLLTGMGRTFTYIENYYGEDAEKTGKIFSSLQHHL